MRKSGIIKTFSGKYLDVFNPDPKQIEIVDIAHGLSMICRFGGQIPRFYSVAEHSYLVAQLLQDAGAPLAAIYSGLMHDAGEAYLWDCPSPIKKNLYEFKAAEVGLMAAIAKKFGFKYPFEFPAIKHTDNQILAVEMAQMQEGKTEEDTNFSFGFWYPGVAKSNFLNLYESLQERISISKNA